MYACHMVDQQFLHHIVTAASDHQKEPVTVDGWNAEHHITFSSWINCSASDGAEDDVTEQHKRPRVNTRTQPRDPTATDFNLILGTLCF